MSEAFIKYTAYTALLHIAMTTGQDEGEGSLGDSIRDAMDPFWYQMTKEEMSLVGKISEEIYVLDGIPIPVADNSCP